MAQDILCDTASGEFGIVYKGLLKKGFTETYTETVAVKTLKGTYLGVSICLCEATIIFLVL